MQAADEAAADEQLEHELERDLAPADAAGAQAPWAE